jgi:hypothetical protein
MDEDSMLERLAALPRAAATGPGAVLAVRIAFNDREGPHTMPEAPKPTQPSVGAQPKRRGERDEGLALIVAIRVLQFFIIVALMLFTSFFGASCLERAGFHSLTRGHSALMALGQPNRQRA